MQRRPTGFTLIELLVVVSIIALLVSILLPSLNQARELAKRVVCASNLKGITLGLNLYANDYGGTLPALQMEGTSQAQMATRAYFGLMGHPRGNPLSWKIVNPYLGNTYELLRCPTETGPGPQYGPRDWDTWYELYGNSYLFNVGPLDRYSNPCAGPPWTVYSRPGGCWGRKIGSIPQPSKLVLASEWGMWWPGYQQGPDWWWYMAYFLPHDPAKPLNNVGFVDGHVKFLEFQESPDHFHAAEYDLAQNF